MRGNPLLAYEQELVSQLESTTDDTTSDDRLDLVPDESVEDDALYPRVRRVVLSHDLLRQAIEAYTGVPLPSDSFFYGLRHCYDSDVHLFVSSPKFPPTEHAVTAMPNVPILRPRR